MLSVDRQRLLRHMAVSRGCQEPFIPVSNTPNHGQKRIGCVARLTQRASGASGHGGVVGGVTVLGGLPGSGGSACYYLDVADPEGLHWGLDLRCVADQDRDQAALRERRDDRGCCLGGTRLGQARV